MKLRATIAALSATMLVIVVMCFSTYNSLSTADEDVRGRWAQVQTVMQRRADLVPALVEVTRQYALHEADLLAGVTERHHAYRTAVGINNQVSSMRELENGLAALTLMAERLLTLRASRVYRNLHYELVGTENRIATERRRYNAAVKRYAALRRTPRGRLGARVLSFGPAAPTYPER